MPRLALLGGEPLRRKPLGRWPLIGDEEVGAVERVLRRGKLCATMYSSEEVAKFEEEFAAVVGVKRAVAVSSGTAALDVVLRAIGVRLGDEVITTPYTFIATATSILHNHGVPVFADVEPATRNIDPREIERRITERTKAIVVVHFAGHPAEMDEIMEIAERHGLYVIEDAAHAHLAEYKGRMAGSLGHAAIFSFQESKNMTAGEGGIITTDDEELAEQCASLREHGRRRDRPWYYHEVLGWNYRMTEIQAAILRVQLRRLPKLTEERRRNARYLSKVLEEFEFLSPPRVAPYVKHAYHLYPLDYQPSVLGIDKHTLARVLQAEGIPLSEGYCWPIYENPIFSDPSRMPEVPFKVLGREVRYGRGLCPVAEKLCYETGMWLPGYVLNAPRDELDDVVRALEKINRCRDELAEASRLLASQHSP